MSGADQGEVKWVNFHPPFSEPPSIFFFSYPSIIEIIFDFSDIITKIHDPFQNRGSALVCFLVLIELRQVNRLNIHSQCFLCFPLLKLFITLRIFLKYNSEYKINKRRTSPYEDAYQLTRVNFVGFQHLNILNK